MEEFFIINDIINNNINKLLNNKELRIGSRDALRRFLYS
tara:strand:+ start:30 stop:146 length:117 start_codon:yes stop_codon:yes gene_type:complete